jgi:hypothetical protein
VDMHTFRALIYSDNLPLFTFGLNQRTPQSLKQKLTYCFSLSCFYQKLDGTSMATLLFTIARPCSVNLTTHPCGIVALF